MADNVSIAGLDKADVLAALYNASKPLGMGFMHYDAQPMQRDEAAALLAKMGEDPYFDYLKGRVMKLNLSSDVDISTRLYDRDNGEGAGAAVIDRLRSLKDVNPEESELQHLEGTRSAAHAAMHMMQQPSRPLTTEGDIAVLHLGLHDVADVLKPYVADVLDDSEE